MSYFYADDRPTSAGDPLGLFCTKLFTHYGQWQRSGTPWTRTYGTSPTLVGAAKAGTVTPLPQTTFQHLLGMKQYSLSASAIVCRWARRDTLSRLVTEFRWNTTYFFCIPPCPGTILSLPGYQSNGATPETKTDDVGLPATIVRLNPPITYSPYDSVEDQNMIDPFETAMCSSNPPPLPPTPPPQ